jgi:hypothetical protein
VVSVALAASPVVADAKYHRGHVLHSWGAPAIILAHAGACLAGRGLPANDLYQSALSLTHQRRQALCRLDPDHACAPACLRPKQMAVWGLGPRLGPGAEPLAGLDESIAKGIGIACVSHA